jgi:hypothetical protein
MRYVATVRRGWLAWPVAVGSILVWLFWGCLDNPTINGANVPIITDPNPTCAEVCHRLAELCGYAPEGDPDGGNGNCTNADASGYCDTQFSPTQITCLTTISSCENAWSTNDGGCAFAPSTPDDDAGDDASSE